MPGLHEIDYPGWIGQEIRALREEFPGWDIWHVSNYLRPGTWCARPKGRDTATINRDDPAAFRAALEAALDPQAAEDEEDARRATVIGLDVAKRARKAGC